MIKRTLIVLIGAYFLAFFSSVAAQTNHIQHQSFFIDKSSQLTFNQILEKSFQEFRGLHNQGYTSAHIWYRIQLDPQSNNTIYLRILPTFLDDLEIYIPQINGGWKLTHSGDQRANQGRDNHYTSLVIELTNIAPSRPVYVRLKTQSSALIHFEVLNLSDLTRLEARRDTVLGIYYGVLICLMLWASINALRFGSWMLGYFAVFELFEISYAIAIMGHLSWIAPTYWLKLTDWLTSTLVITHVLTGFLFHSAFMTRLDIPRWVKIIQYGFTGLYLGYLVLFWFGQERLAILLTNTTLIPAATVLLLASYYAYKSIQPDHRLIGLTYLLLFLTVIASIAPYVGIIQAVQASLYASLVNGMVSSILMYNILNRQHRKLSSALEQAQTEAALMQKRHQEQGQFMTMLTHEIKTPLSVLKLLIDSLGSNPKIATRAQDAIESIDQIIERCKNADRIEQGKLRPHFSQHNLEELLAFIRKHSNDSVNVNNQCPQSTIIETDVFLWDTTFGNLIDNAKKYSLAGQPINISFSPTANQGILIQISNTIGAAGLPDEKQLFDKYYRAERAHSVSGSGLGLYIVKYCIESLGGTITYSHDEQTITFTIWLPQRISS